MRVQFSRITVAGPHLSAHDTARTRQAAHLPSRGLSREIRGQLMSATADESAAEAVTSALLSYNGPDFSPPYQVEAMPGGASTRKFFRVRARSGKSLVAMFVPKPSQEVEKARQAQNCRPFVEVADLLRSHEVNVPQIYREFSDLNVLLVEDLGDLTLAEFLKISPGSKEALYREAVQALARAQGSLASLPDESIVRARSFDSELLLWEIHHFDEYALRARAITLDTEETRIFAEAAEFLANSIAKLPQGFAHRDYQSRNLMLKKSAADAFQDPSETASPERRITWIDFQDAMLGPRVYDLVALLTDSYQTFDREFVVLHLKEYAEELGRPEELAEIIAEFDLVTVQRKLKDAGRFVFLDRVNQAPHFMKYVEPTIDKVLDALSRLEHIAALSALHRLLRRRLRSF
jgi:N-acetylmuramate 1-kinase